MTREHVVSPIALVRGSNSGTDPWHGCITRRVSSEICRASAARRSGKQFILSAFHPFHTAERCRSVPGSTGSRSRPARAYFSRSRGMSSTKLQGRLRLSSCSARCRPSRPYRAVRAGEGEGGAAGDSAQARDWTVLVPMVR